MSGPDRPEPLDPNAAGWPDDDDVEATRVVRRNPPGQPEDAPDGGAATGTEAAPPGYAWAPAAADAGPTSVMAPIGPAAIPPAAPTSYLGAPTTAYPGTDPSSSPYPEQGGYSYQQPPAAGGPPIGGGPQAIPPPATANVFLPQVRMPKAESRVALNLLGAIVGLLLVAGGLALVLLNEGRVRRVDAADLGSVAAATAGNGTIVAVPLVLTILGVVLIAVAALISAWASWAPILPGLLLAAVSVWAMVTTGANGGGAAIAKGTRWAFSHGELALFCMSGLGLLVGLGLLATGLAAVFLRAGVRRTIRQQLESIQS